MALEDIEKLKEKVARDPNSKLFVPLSDEYRKMGMLDEAISVLISGLENQPNYMSARVALGKVYLEKQMLSEAKEEFQKVIAAIPDNLFAHKKFAEICRDLGDTDRAISEYKIVLKLNPLDEDSMSNLESLQNKPKVAEAPAAPSPTAGDFLEHTAHAEPTAAEEEAAEIFPEEEQPAAMPVEEFEAFKKSMTEKVEGSETEEAIEAEEVIAEGDIDLKEVEKEAMTYVDMFKEEAAVEPRLESPMKEEIAIVEKPAAKEATPASRVKEAEEYIAQGNYSRAVNIYRELHAADPGNKIILQKIEELKMLLKMLGKDQEATVARLEAFGEGLKKGRDEFFKGA